MRFQRKAAPEASSKCPLMSHWPRWGHRATPSNKEVGELVFSFSNLRVTDLYPEKGAWEMGNGLATSSICHLSHPVLLGLPIALIRRHCLLAPLLHLLDCPACPCNAQSPGILGSCPLLDPFHLLRAFLSSPHLLNVGVPRTVPGRPTLCSIPFPDVLIYTHAFVLLTAKSWPLVPSFEFQAEGSVCCWAAQTSPLYFGPFHGIRWHHHPIPGARR